MQVGGSREFRTFNNFRCSPKFTLKTGIFLAPLSITGRRLFFVFLNVFVLEIIRWVESADDQLMISRAIFCGKIRTQVFERQTTGKHFIFFSDRRRRSRFRGSNPSFSTRVNHPRRTRSLGTRRYSGRIQFLDFRTVYPRISFRQIETPVRRPRKPIDPLFFPRPSECWIFLPRKRNYRTETCVNPSAESIFLSRHLCPGLSVKTAETCDTTSERFYNVPFGDVQIRVVRGQKTFHNLRNTRLAFDSLPEYIFFDILQNLVQIIQIYCNYYRNAFTVIFNRYQVFDYSSKQLNNNSFLHHMVSNFVHITQNRLRCYNSITMLYVDTYKRRSYHNHFDIIIICNDFAYLIPWDSFIIWMSRKMSIWLICLKTVMFV